MYAAGPQAPSISRWSLETDASPWGGGAVLKVGGKATQYTAWVWSDADVKHLGVVTGIPKYQTFWEMLCVALSLVTWSPQFTQQTLTVLCDNKSSLQAALDLKGKHCMLAIARELAWRKARYQWSFAVAHLPKEQNTVADALSRLQAPDAAPLPKEVSQAVWRDPTTVASFWKLADP